MKLTRCDVCRSEVSEAGTFVLNVTIFEGQQVRFEGRGEACSITCAAKLLRERQTTLENNMRESASRK